MIDVSVIIVNYNTCNLTLQCLSSIYEKSKDINFEVIVVDNASSDDTVAYVRQQFPQVILIQSPNNIGFGKANNLGSKVAKGKYLFLLNSDTLLLNNVIKIFYDSMEQMPSNVACLGSMLIDTNQNIIHSYGKFPSISETLKDSFLTYLPFLRKKGIFEDKNAKYPLNVDYITGADLFIKKEVIDKNGLFDPDFFMYYEETEMQHRYAKKGYKCVIIDTPSIVHLEGASGNKDKKEYWREILFTKSRFVYFKKTENLIIYYFFRLSFSLLQVLPTLLRPISFKAKTNYLKSLIK